MSTKARVRIGGLMRCCLLTLEGTCCDPIEGERITCIYCGNNMRFRDGAWEWDPPKMKHCPECDGEGEVWWDADYVDRGGLGGRSPVQRYAKCDRCDGTGEIEDEEAGEDE